MARIWQNGFEIPYYRYTGNEAKTIPLDGYTLTASMSAIYPPFYGFENTPRTNGKGSYCFSCGTRSIQGYNGAVECYSSFSTELSELYVRFYFKVENSFVSTRENQIFKIVDNSSNSLLYLKITMNVDKTYVLKVYNSSNTLLYTTELISNSTWSKFDIHLKIATDGLIEFKTNDKLNFSWNGDTKGSYGLAKKFYFGRLVKDNNVRDETYKLSFDDFAINDTSGTTNNGWCGNGSIVALPPISNGSLVEFTPSTGSNWQNVDEITVSDEDETYNAIVGAEKTDLFKIKKLSDLSVADTTNINAVSIVANARFDESSSAIAPVIKGTNITEGNKTTILGSYTSYVLGIYNVNPETSTTFTSKNLADLEFGYRSKE